MWVEVFYGRDLIGRARLDHLDPPMGVAFGVFTPTISYNQEAHAGPDRGLIVKTVQGEQIECEGAAIESAPGHLGLEVLGIPYPIYSQYFAAHPDYEAYWKR